ncbi:MAG: replication restart helicase PriA [Acidobacteriota bacterium]
MTPDPPAAAPPVRRVQVALPVPPRKVFTYGLPEGLPEAPPGARVRVPFSGRTLVGWVVAEGGDPVPGPLKPVQEVLDRTPLLPPDLLAFTRWVADYYLVSWGSVLRCAYPSALDPSPRARYRLGSPPDPPPPALAPLFALLAEGPLSAARLLERLGADSLPDLWEAVGEGWVLEETLWKARRSYARRDRVALLLPPDEAAARAGDRSLPPPLRKALKALLAFQNRGFPLLHEAARLARVPQHVFFELSEAGWAELFDLVPPDRVAAPSPHVLSDEQAGAVAAVSGALREGRHATFLLFGVTGSGKTEVFLRLMAEALSLGGTALYLVPEISLTSLLARRLIARFGSAVAVLHSSMTEVERVRQWRRVRRGEARVVIGPRSALFAPLPELRLIVVDEEHDPSYKQQEFPRYHARDMAVVRGGILGVPVVLGSATPSVESFYNASEAGKYTLLRLPERAGGASLPPVVAVDMREEFRTKGARAPLSGPLLEALAETLARGEQAVILRNRLGFSTFVLCRECGKTIQCPNCSVSLTFHRKWGGLKCHYCGHRAEAPESCPSCGGGSLQFLGEGTEKVEDLLAEAFPGTRVARMDREEIRTGAQFDRLWTDFERGRIGILVGTQMVAKGHDVPNVTLAGVLSADFILGMPDFRAAERVFQLVTQAAGRAGRGGLAGRVILQSYHPDHYAVAASLTHDFEAFYERDIRYRKSVGYPPVEALARLEIRQKDLPRLDALCAEVSAVLRGAASRGVRVFGPVDAPRPRLEGKHRRHVLLRARQRRRLQALLEELLRSDLARHVPAHLLVEMDPYQMM